MERPTGARLSERRLPIYSRWTLVAQGSVERSRFARPQCPVASWLLEHRPELVPHDPDPDRLSAVRARTEVVDALALQVRDAAHDVGRQLSVWTLGAGFDARWARLAGPMAPVVTRWVELDDPRVVAAKRVALRESPFSMLWDHVEAIAIVPVGWSVDPEPGERPLVILEGLLHRLPTTGLRGLLRRLRETAPNADVILDLTGIHGVARAGWSDRRLRQIGWRVADDVELAFRDVLFDNRGDEVCAGMVPVRIVRLVAA